MSLTTTIPEVSAKAVMAPKQSNQFNGHENGIESSSNYSAEPVRQLKGFLSEDKYGQAVIFGRKERQNLVNFPNRDTNLLRALAEFDIYYAKVLIYTGEVESGITLLNRVIAEIEGEPKPGNIAWQTDPQAYEGRWQYWVLGQAHNLLGYAYWMELGHLKFALQEFDAALVYFQTIELEAEMATTEDNIGRVYILQNNIEKAFSFLSRSLGRRFKLGDDYRIALSYNSWAIAYLELSKLGPALKLATEALAIFKKQQTFRGVGLASITLGRALRQGGHRDSLSQAEFYLKQAVHIFEARVVEPIRLIEAYNELSCIYHAKMTLAYQDKHNHSMDKNDNKQ